MLFTLSEILTVAQKNKYAVVAPDFFSLAFAQMLLNCAEENRAPIILSYCDNKTNTFELNDEVKCIQLVRELSISAQIPVVFHLDHAPSIEVIHKYLDLGFNSVMIDASSHPMDENIEITQKVVELAKKYNASVEAELGHVGNGSDYLVKDPSEADLTNIDQVCEFTSQTNVDALAISIGTQHGFYRNTSGLHFNLLERIAQSTTVPLVLHGTSGTEHEQIKKAVSLGICKLNVFTDLFTMYEKTANAILPTNLEQVFNQKLACLNAVKDIYSSFLKTGGSLGKSSDFLCSDKSI